MTQGIPGTAPKMWRAPGRSRKLYEPTDLQPGAWITWTRHCRSGANGTIHETETIRGQIWSAADGPRSVWAIPEGERRPVRVAECRRTRTLDEFAEPIASVVKRRAVSEGTIVVEAEELRPGDVVVGEELHRSSPAIEDLAKSRYAGAIVESVGEKRKNRSHYNTSRGIDAYEVPVRLSGNRTMIVHHSHAVRVIRAAQRDVCRPEGSLIDG